MAVAMGLLTAIVTAAAPTLGPWAFEAANPMTQPRAHAALAVTATAVYVSGGGIGSQGLAHTNSVEYATISGGDLSSWSTTAPMNTVRTLLGMASIGGALIVAGGQTGDHDPLTSVEIAIPEPDDTILGWTTSSWALNEPRSGLRMVSHDDCVYVLGGGNASGSLPTIEAATAGIDASGHFTGLNRWVVLYREVPAIGWTEPIATETHLYLVIQAGAYSQVFRAAFLDDSAEDCALGPWDDTVAPLTFPNLGNPAAVLSHGRMYLIGGVLAISDSSATTRNSVWSAPMGLTGRLASGRLSP